jgi:signal transduction histidine kinase
MDQAEIENIPRNMPFIWNKLKFAIVLFFPLILAVNGILYIYYDLEAKSAAETTKERAENIITLQEIKIKSNFKAIATDLLFLANYHQVAEMLDGSAASLDKLANDFSLFSRGSNLFDQIRLLDITGMEILRINLVEKEPVIVTKNDLQFKGKRYYFQDTIALNKGEVFVSPFDLNIENGKIETPIKPMIRFGTPIFDKSNRSHGALLFNYIGKNMIREINDLTPESFGFTLLLNTDGYYIIGRSPKEEWGFMYKDRKEQTMKVQFPEAWETISSSESGQFQNQTGLFTFTTVYPIIETWKSSVRLGINIDDKEWINAAKANRWKLVSYLPAKFLAQEQKTRRNKYISISFVLLLMLGFVSWVFASAKEKKGIAVWELEMRTQELFIANEQLQNEIRERKCVQKKLICSHNELEQKVLERTAELASANKQLNDEINVREKTEEELLIARDAAEAASKAKSLFIANMSHELRTPISGILVSADLALGQKLSPKIEKIQKTISQSSRALLRTVNTILDFSKSEDGKLELSANPFRLDEVLGKLSGTFVQKGVQKQIKISLDIAAGEVTNALIGDSDRLLDIFNHLLDNAAKFSTNVPKVTIGVRDLDKSEGKTTLEFYVKDNGIGIASEDFQKIFDAFTQVDASSTRQYDGTGMGLAVSKRLVERMGGEIRVESELGKGSTFYFTASFDRQDQKHPFKAPSFEDQEETTANRNTSKADGKMGNPELLLELLSTIGPFIQKRKPKQCKEIMAEISEYRWPDEYAQEIAELDRLIGKYKFKDALPIYESTMEKLKS